MLETIHLQKLYARMHNSKVRRARSVVRRKEAIAIDGPCWTEFATVDVCVLTVAKADVRGQSSDVKKL